jgi:tetratricopeptide (TPR) repeat protein
MVLTLLCVIVFSIVQGWEQVLLLVAASAAILVVPLIRKRPLNKTFVWTTLGAVLVLTVLFLLFRIPQFKQMIVLDESKLITQITIDPQVSWKVATSSISESLWRGVVGLGQDTFSIGYNLYRPLSSETVLLNATNFTTANTQLLNILATRGVVGILTWLALGFFIGRMFVMDVRKHKFETFNDFLLVVLDVTAIYIFLSSFLIYFTFMMMFLLLLVLTLGVIVRSEKMYGNVEKFVINWGLFLQKPEEGNARPVATSVLVIIATAALISMLYLGRYTLGAVNVLEAETVSAQGRKMLEQDDLSDKERAEMLVKASNLYGSAVALSPNNDVLHRRASLIVSQYVEYLAQRYNESESTEEKEQLFEEIATYIEIVVEESKRATDLNPGVYANWGTRASIYSKLVGLGLTSYTKSSLTALQNAADLNPLNYELYYNAAQLYVVNNDNDSALRTLSQVFSINPDHIPSLVLAGELSLNDGDTRQALRYFADAKEVMDELGTTSSDVYEYVVKKLNEVEDSQPAPQDSDDEEDESV